MVLITFSVLRFPVSKHLFFLLFIKAFSMGVWSGQDCFCPDWMPPSWGDSFPVACPNSSLVIY